MARARNIKPSFFQNEALGELDPLTRLFFIGLWTVADYKGCLEYRPKRLLVQLMPYDLGFDPEQAVKNLSEYGFIRSYVSQEKTYLKIVNFEKHQSPHKNERATNSGIPDIDESGSVRAVNNEVAEKTEKIGLETEKIGTARADCFKPLPDSLLVDAPQNATPKQRKASRIPEPFFLNPELKQWAAERAPNVDVMEETEKFVNHWRAKSGRDATKLDWPATWRNWILNAKKWTGSSDPVSPTSTDPPEWKLAIDNCPHCDGEGLIWTEDKRSRVCDHAGRMAA